MVKLESRSWLLQVTVLAFLYFSLGKLALLMAIPPGFAAPIWPPIGVGIAALLLFGANRWPACFVGSFFLNLIVAWGPNSVPAALAVACGTCFGILAAVYLARRILNFPKSFYLEKDIILFLIICGPLAAVISSTWNTLFLLWFDKIHPENFFINWLHWFVGDATGGIIFSPLALIFSERARKYWMGSIYKVLLPLAVCLLLLIGALQYINRVESSQITVDFHRQADLSYSLLEKDLNSYQSLLGTLQSFYENSNDVSREEFKNFTYHLLSRTPEIHALLWVPVASESHYSFSAKYAEPPEQSRYFLDINLANHAEYKNLILKALRTRSITASPPITIHDIEDVSLALAVGNPRGVLIEVVDPKIVMNSLFSFANDPSYRMKVTDISLPHHPAQVMAAMAKEHTQNFFKGQLHWSRTINFGDRTWLFEIEQDPTLKPSAIFTSAMFLISSLIFAFLICALLLTTANRIITTQALVDQKTEHLRELNVQLEKASKTKSEFLANMSHEIRTPLNVIVGMTDLLEDAPLQPQQRHYLDISRRAGDNLLNIINDILDISKIESGLVTLEKAALNLPEIVRDVFEMFTPKAREKGLDFRMHVNENAQNIYLGDPTRTRQILSNLVANALKFTDKGFVEIRVSAFADPATPGNIHFEVQDSGIGISKDVIPSLFKPFTQADSTITRKFGGTGLGLSICKRLTEMMNGSIWVDSELDHGATFHFTLTLPYVRRADQRMTPATTKPLGANGIPSLRILIVDDADDNRMLIRAYLDGTHHKIFEADSGQQALEMYELQEFDVVLMDMQMPGMDGFTAVRKIREFETRSGRRPAHIWALTAYALKNEIQRSLDAGCERHLTKPLRKQELLKEISNYNQTRH